MIKHTMEANKDQIQQSQQGTGSAENKGEKREKQVAGNTDISSREKSDIAKEIGVSSGQVFNLKDLGALSGRDDASGGSGDRMENENTRERTDR